MVNTPDLCYDGLMYYQTLEHIPPQELYETFIEAFSDYTVDVRMDRQTFMRTNDQRSVSLRDSYGAFTEDGTLVGFILCGVRSTGGAVDFYDGATAVIASMRGQGIASQLLKSALRRAQERNARSFILEVIKENEGARRLYASHGFTDNRILRCFEISRKDLPAPPSFEDDILDLDSTHYTLCSEAVGLSYRPSWQNDTQSIRELFPYLRVRGIRRDGAWVGCYVLYPQKGDLMQIGALHDDPEIYRLLVTDAFRHTESDSMSIINIEASSPLCSYLLCEGWSVMIDQWEMVRSF